MDTFIHYAMAAAHFAMEDSGLPVSDENRERVAVVVGSGIGGLPLIEETQKRVRRERHNARVISPFFITGAHRERGRGEHLDQVRPEGAEPRDRDGLHDRRARGRRGLPHDPVRRGGRRDRRRHRVGHHAAGRRRFRRHAGALDAQRRAAARVASLGPRPRRLRDRRRARASSSWRRWRRRRSAARASTASSPATACRATPTTSPLRRKTATGRRASCATALEDAEINPDEVGLHQRPRHLDARSATRSRRWRSRWSSATHAQQARRLLHQVHDGAPARRRRGARDRDLRAGGREPGHAADDQLRDPGPRVRPRLRAERGAGRSDRATRSPTPSASAAPTAASILQEPL